MTDDELEAIRAGREVVGYEGLIANGCLECGNTGIVYEEHESFATEKMLCSSCIGSAHLAVEIGTLRAEVAALLEALDEARGELGVLRFQHTNATRAAEDAHEAQQRLAGITIPETTDLGAPYGAVGRCIRELAAERDDSRRDVERLHRDHAMVLNELRAQQEPLRRQLSVAMDSAVYVGQRETLRTERDEARAEVERLRAFSEVVRVKYAVIGWDDGSAVRAVDAALDVLDAAAPTEAGLLRAVSRETARYVVAMGPCDGADEGGESGYCDDAACVYCAMCRAIDAAPTEVV